MTKELMRHPELIRFFTASVPDMGNRTRPLRYHVSKGGIYSAGKMWTENGLESAIKAWEHKTGQKASRSIAYLIYRQHTASSVYFIFGSISRLRRAVNDARNAISVQEVMMA